MLGRDAQRTGRTPFAGPIAAPTQPLWTANAGDLITGTPVLDGNGSILIGNYRGQLSSFDTITGALRWRYQAGIVIRSTPSVLNETIYLGSDTNGTTGTDCFVALFLNGTRRWGTDLGGASSALRRASALTPDGSIVYVGSNRGLHALNSSDGSTIWLFATSNTVASAPAISPIDGAIAFGCDDGAVRAVSPNGTLKWTLQTIWKQSASPAYAADGTVFVGGVRVYALNSSGTVLWMFKEPSGLPFALASPTLGDADATVYISAEKNWTYALDARSGTVKWNSTIGTPIFPSTSLAYSVASRLLYVGTAEGFLYAINTTNGNKTFTFPLPEGRFCLTSPVISRQGTLYVGTTGGLCAYR